MFRGARGVRRKVPPPPLQSLSCWRPVLAVAHDLARAAKGRTTLAAAATASRLCKGSHYNAVHSPFTRQSLDVRICAVTPRDACTHTGRMWLSSCASADVQHRTHPTPFFQPFHPNPHPATISEGEGLEPSELDSAPTEGAALEVGSDEISLTSKQKHNAKLAALYLWTRYTPHDYVRLAPITSDPLANDLDELCAAVERGAHDDAWSAFVSHLQHVRTTDNRLSVRMPTDMFDACFWLIASENSDHQRLNPPEALIRHKEVLNRTRILLEYADAVDIEVSQLQVRRFIYISITLWEQQAKGHRAAAADDYDDSVLLSDTFRLCGDMDSALVGRIVTRLLLSDRLDDARLLTQEWHKRATTTIASRTEQRRIESWTSGGQAIEPEYIRASLRCADFAFEPKTLALVLVRSLRHNALDLAIGVLQLGNIDLTHRSVSKFLRESIPVDQLWQFVPKELREAVQKAMPTSPIKVVGSHKTRFPLHSSPAKVREQLFFAACDAMTMAGDVRLAAYFVLHNDDGGFAVPFNDTKLTRIALDAAVVVAHRSSQCSDRDADYALNIASLSIRFLERTRSSRDPVRSQAHALLVVALQRRLRAHMTAVKTQEDDAVDANPLPLLARRLTQDIVTHDPALRHMRAVNAEAHAVLLNLLIGLREFRFAMQVFALIEDESASPLTAGGFLWLFQAALSDDKTSKHVPARLFVHWLTSNLRDDDKLPHLPQGVLRLFFKSLLKQSRYDQALLLEPLLAASGGGLLKYRKDGKRARSSLSRDPQVSRWLNVLKQVPGHLSNASLTMSLRILQLRREDAETRKVVLLTNLVALHNKFFASFIAVAPLRDALQRAQVLGAFHSLRSQALSRLDAAPETRANLEPVLRQSYSAALRILQADLAAHAAPKVRVLSTEDDDAADAERKRAQADAVTLLLDELRVVWRSDLRAKEEASDEVRTFTTSYILSLVAYDDLQGAHSYFVDEMQSFDQWATGKASDAEQGAATRPTQRKLKPLPVSLASRLALGLGRAADFGAARDVLSVYMRCTQHVLTPEYRNITRSAGRAKPTVMREKVDARRALIECAGVALLCMQDRSQEALDRIYSLERLGVFGAPPEASGEGRSYSPTSAAGYAGLASFGPSNAQLSELFVGVVHSTLAFERYGDWGAALEEACDKLTKWTSDDEQLAEIRGSRVHYDDSNFPSWIREGRTRG